MFAPLLRCLNRWMYLAVLFGLWQMQLVPFGIGQEQVPEPFPKAAGQPEQQYAGGKISFEQHVQAVLSKAGCNTGACHGNFNGRGGFFLSLRGQDASYDFQQIVHAAAGRRIDPIDPDRSLLLAKATAEVPHEGGRRFKKDSIEYQLLASWIRAGSPPPAEASGNASANASAQVVEILVAPANLVLFEPEREVQLQVLVTMADGTVQDVTRMAVYEPSDPAVMVSEAGVVRFDSPRIVSVAVRYLNQQTSAQIACRPARQDFVWNAPPANNWIDQLIFDRLAQLKINPASLTDDSKFLRRLSLDLRGVPPTAEEAREFLSDTSAEKRTALIDRYLASKEFALLWAQRWSDLLRNEEKTLDSQGVEKLHAWLCEQFDNDLPIDQLVRSLITARGRTYDNPPANFWRAHREPFVRSETVAQVFLGIRLQCAKCHNHPFDRWSQDEYYQWSSLFAGIDYEVIDNQRKDSLDKHEFVGDQIVLVSASGSVDNPKTGSKADGKLLGSDLVISGDRLESLAAWMTAADNRLFVKTQVNRVWYHLMGVGLVEPIDDLRMTNPASHPELLERLADQWIADGFSLKKLVREIVRSRTYQLDSSMDLQQFSATEQVDPRLLARAVIHRLTAEQVMDAQSQVLGLPGSFEGYPSGTRAIEIAGVERVRRKLSADDQFLRLFGKPSRLLACECERTNEPALGQALTLVGGVGLHERLQRSDNLIGKLLQEKPELTEIVDQLYWIAFARAPSADELSQLNAALTRDDQRPLREKLEDLWWAVLNSKELLFRH